MNGENFVIILGFVLLAVYSLSELSKYFFWRQIRRNTIDKKKYYQILVPKDNQYGALTYARFLTTLHNLSTKKKNKTLFSLEIYSTNNSVKFYLVISEKNAEYVISQLYSEFPDIQIFESKDFLNKIYKSSDFLAFKKNKDFKSFFRTSEELGENAIGSLIAALSSIKMDNESSSLQILLTPYYPKQSQVDSSSVNVQEASSNYKYFLVEIRSIVSTPDKSRSKKISQDLTQAFKQFDNPNGNTISAIEMDPKKNILFFFQNLPSIFGLKKIITDPIFFLRNRVFRDEFSSALTIEELSSIFYFPNDSITNPNIEWLRSRKIPFPINIPLYNPELKSENPRIFAATDYRDVKKIFGIKKIDRRRHFYLLGKTGTGKSTLLKNLIVGDIYFGEGVGVLDPHGDLIDEILDLIPDHRKEDVILVDPSDSEFPVGLNMLDMKSDETMELLADGIINVFKKFFADSWGPRLQYILTNTILTLLHCQNLSLLAVPRILMDKNYRRFLLKQVDDAFLLKYWNEEYENLSQNSKLLSETISPILNKVGRFLNSTMIRNMIGQVKSTVDLADVMNSGKILLINLSQGKIGEENSSLLGGMLVTRLYSNAMQRAKIDESKRRDFYLYVDEFQNFANDSFIKILSEARKYGLALTITHQYIDQIDKELVNAIFGNVGTVLNYVVGNKDAEILAKEYHPYLTPNDLVNMDRFNLALKMTIDGQQSKPFTAVALKPFYKKIGKSEEIRDLSRKKFAKSKEEIELKLSKWANSKYDSKGNLIQKKI